MRENRYLSARRIWHLLALSLAGIASTAALGQTATEEASDVAKESVDVVELKTGDLAPLFELQGLKDKTIKLKDFRKSATSSGKNVVVVFVRAYW